ncbi:MAG: DUF1501 domain-containing protein [Verrucomicrobia subdivision 3 bacterium]|nr:DUF1501 domain-containing protein [Limisphaerales bacterium]
MGGLGLGLTLGDFLSLEANAAGEDWRDVAKQSKPGKAKNIINIFLPGGSAHQESWDPKYLSPAEYRGPLGTVKTNTGERFSQNLKNTAKVADKIAVIRSMTHGEAAHERGTHNMMTGIRPSPAVIFPSIGSIVSHEFGPRKNLPPYVAIPSQSRNGGTGYLGSAYGPFSLGADPGNANFRVRDLALPNGIDASRFSKRRDMRSIVDGHFSALEKSDALAGMDSFYQRAYAMISSPEARDAFDLNKEPAKLRDEYGRNTAGGRFLLARRLVESGVRMVSTTYGGWDHHSNIAAANGGQMPAFDQAFAALIRDLDTRGMLDETLVLVTSEFGRTPKINATAGRDHWPKVFSVVMAGGGVKGGYIHGMSDPTGAEPEEDPVHVPDWAATVYSLIGIDPQRRLVGPGNRPMPINYDGEILKEALT